MRSGEIMDICGDICTVFDSVDNILYNSLFFERKFVLDGSEAELFIMHIPGESIGHWRYIYMLNIHFYIHLCVFTGHLVLQQV